MFKTYANRIADGSPELFNNSGRRVVPTFHLEVTSKGYPALTQDGEHDLYSEIQSYSDQCDLQNVLQSFDLASGVSPMNYDDASGGVVDFVKPDLSGQPNTVGNVFNDARACNDFFARLPLDVRKHFGHSVVNFESAVCDGSVMDELRKAYGIPEEVPDVPSEVIDRVQSVNPVQPVDSVDSVSADVDSDSDG